MSINSNAGSFNPQNSTIIPLASGLSFDGVYTSCLNFSVIEISIKTDTTFDFNIIYSSDGVQDEFTNTIVVSVPPTDTLFYKFEPKMRYFKVQLLNSDSIDQSILSLQCLLKSTLVYSINSGTGSDVNIISPLNLDGSVFVGGNLTLTGDVNANITNASLDVAVSNLTDLSGVYVDVDISGQYVNVANLTDLSGIAVDISGQYINNTNLDKLTFDPSNNLNVYDSSIYNLLNTRGSNKLWDDVIGIGGDTNFLDLSNKKVNNLTFYGNQNSNGNKLTVLFSNDNITYYQSQYSYQYATGSNGDFGFSIQSCPKYLLMRSQNACNLTLYVDYC